MSGGFGFGFLQFIRALLRLKPEGRIILELNFRGLPYKLLRFRLHDVYRCLWRIFFQFVQGTLRALLVDKPINLLLHIQVVVDRNIAATEKNLDSSLFRWVAVVICLLCVQKNHTRTLVVVEVQHWTLAVVREHFRADDRVGTLFSLRLQLDLLVAGLALVRFTARRFFFGQNTWDLHSICKLILNSGFFKDLAR